MVSLAIEEVIPPDMERLATGTVSVGAGVDGEVEIVAKRELEVGGMVALVSTAAQHAMRASLVCRFIIDGRCWRRHSGPESGAVEKKALSSHFL
jgi:hypothetical protein